MAASLRRLDPRIVALVPCAIAIIVIAVSGITNPRVAIAIMAEGSVAEWLQVVLVAAAGVLAARQGWTVVRAGHAPPFEIAVVTATTMICIGEVDLDRLLFDTKVVATLFFVSPKYPLVYRILAVVVIVVVPAGIGVWLLTRWRQLRDVGVAALREPWGQTAAFGILVYVVVQVFEGPIDRIPWQQHRMIEETSELVGAVCVFVGLAARQGLRARVPGALRSRGAAATGLASTASPSSSLGPRAATRKLPGSGPGRRSH